MISYLTDTILMTKWGGPKSNLDTCPPYMATPAYVTHKQGWV